MTDRTQLLADLDALDALFSGPEKWTKGAYARSAKRRPCDIYSPLATCWCLSGGAEFVAANNKRPLLKAVVPDSVNIPETNDAPDFQFSDLKQLISDARERVAGGTA